ncbi:diguanylate cyclase domain-containing protein [Geodermatophilus sp. SYSU D00697]
MTSTAAGDAQAVLHARQAEILAASGIGSDTTDAELDAVVRVAAAVTGMPNATLNLLDADEQHQVATHGAVGCSSPRGESLCATVTTWAPRVYAFPDLAALPEFAGNAWVDGRRARIRGYASAPLVADGTPIGALCVYDEQPREIGPGQCDRLADLAAVVLGLLQRRRQSRELAALAAASEVARQEAERAHGELARSEAFVRALLEALPVGVVAADADGRVTLFNEVSRRWHGVDADSRVPVTDLPTAFSLTQPDGRLLLREEVPLTRVFAEGRITEVGMGIAPLGGTVRQVVASGTRVRDEDGTLLGAVVAMADVTAQRELEQALRAAALHDPLTGLPNRALLMDRLGQHLRSGGRVREPLAVLFCDLDGFKPVNDTAGHAVGDQVLVSAAERLQAAMRPGDTVARVGGDEFVVLCPGLDCTGAARAVADRVTAAFEAPLRDSRGGAHRVGVSVGVALCGPADTPETALAAADAAMYRVKIARRSALPV